MSTPLRPRATEERLYQIRQAASAAPAGPSPTGHPQIQGRDSYYGLPALKPPVWTWQVPLYFYFGGIAGVSAVMAFAAHLFRAEPAMVRLLLWMALVGAAVCPPLLIADLGKPSRFLNMLRVFKIRSPMSMGAWILVAFSGFAFIALAAHELGRRGVDSPPLVGLGWFSEALAAVTGLLLASYTGVLIGATAIPVWFSNRRILPPHFLTSGLGSSAGILELAGFLVPATQILGFLAAGVETLLEVSFLVRRRSVDGPLHRGLSGNLFRVAGLLEGPAALAIRLIWGSAPAGRWAAAICFLLGALLSRYAWIWAGQASARDPRIQFADQRAGGARP